MKKRFGIGKCLLVLIFSGIFSHDSFAQLATKSQEVWPALDLYYKISPKSRLYGTVSGTKLQESNYADGGVGIYFDYFTFPLKLANKFLPDRNDSLPGKFLWLRGGYQYGASPPEAENPFKEHIVVTELNSRSYLPFEVLLTLKNRIDWRVLDGDFKSRYRPRLMMERDLRTEYMFFTASAFVEYFAYFGNSSINRFRTQVGVEFRVTRFINYEVYWNHQFANGDEVAENDAFGMSLKAYLTRGVKVVNFKKKNQPKAGS
ncbi:DUF2490 domain-containing protein [Algoriphagus lacus]|uniref:DUF2490 domain-containing protein n=1 Tax=Algoriphagus lacus TaxID=2056311 RepID=A0A418PS92_9BACT|nr:DUF2490 domain-containing protein [Algoriphagus lacus]RIW15712.1 DUF2490 domain-containing protein [Algoriphagus lacus]